MSIGQTRAIVTDWSPWLLLLLLLLMVMMLLLASSRCYVIPVPKSLNEFIIKRVTLRWSPIGCFLGQQWASI